MNIIEYIILYGGLIGGLSVLIVLVIATIVAIYQHFTWKKIVLTDEEKEELIKALKAQYPATEAMNKITDKRGGIAWKTFNIDKTTGEVKIK